MATRRVVFHRQPVVFLAAAGIELPFHFEDTRRGSYEGNRKRSQNTHDCISKNEAFTSIIKAG